MPLYTHAGLGDLDYTPGTIRTEMSDTLFASLYMRPNLLAALPIGQFGGGGTGVGNAVQQLLHYWIEDKLNPRQVTENDAGIGTGAASFTVSNSDGALLDIGYILQDNAQSQLTAEQVQVTGLSAGASNTTVSVNRGVNGTTAATHAASAVWTIVATPQIQGSDLGRDMSRVPGIKSNLIQTWRRDVVITSSMLALAKHGLVPGIPNQLAYQLHQRFLEMLIDMERTVLLGLGTPSATQSEYQTMWGILPWLGYAPVIPNATATLYNASGAMISDFIINQLVINIYQQGGEIPDVLLVNPTGMDRLGRIYRDQLRIQQAELVRGYMVDAIRVSLGTQLVKLIMSGYMPGPTAAGSQTPTPTAAALDVDRLALIPFLDQFCYLLSAPTFKDGDAISVVAKFTLEARNTGTDFGYASQVLYNYAV